MEPEHKPYRIFSLSLRYRRQASKSEITSVGIAQGTSLAFAISLGSQAAQSWVDVFDLVTQRGHSKTAGSHAVFSPKGDRIACLRNWTTQLSGGVEHHYASTVLIRDAVSGKTVMELKEATSWPMAWSRDGRYLAVGEDGGPFPSRRIGVWDARTGLRKGRVVGHFDTIKHAVFAPDGNLATQSHDGIVRITNFATGKTERRLMVACRSLPYPRALAVSADGASVTSIWAETVQQWLPLTHHIVSYDLNSRRKIEGFPLCVSPDGDQVVCWTEDGFDVMSVASGTIMCAEKTDVLVTAAAFSADGKVLLLGKINGMLEVWDISLEVKRDLRRMDSQPADGSTQNE